MPEDDNVSIVGTIISGLIGIYSYISGNTLLQWLGAVLFGAFLTYFVQSRLQKRTEEERLRKRNVETIFAPLYLEIKTIRENLLDYPLARQGWPSDAWRDISNSFKRFVLGDELEKEVRAFYLQVREHSSEINDARRYIDRRIRFFF